MTELSTDELLLLYGNLTASEILFRDADQYLPESKMDFLYVDTLSDSSIKQKIGNRELFLHERNEVGIREIRSQFYEKRNAEIKELHIAESDRYRVCLSETGTEDQIRISTEGENDNESIIQAYILNLSAPASVDEFEMILYYSEPPMLDIEYALCGKNCDWTSPRWGKAGDVIFFTHGKSAFAKIAKARMELKRNREFYSEEEYNNLSALIDKARSLHSEFGGKIFAFGRLVGAPERIDKMLVEEGLHYTSRIFANVGDITVLKEPICVDDCVDFLQISMTSGITPVMGNEFDQLRELVSEKNCVPQYFMNVNATPLPLSKIDQNTWMTLAKDFRCSFMYEKQFRYYYVDYFLKAISDIKTIYRECGCKKEGIGYSFIDNVILFGKRYLPVEVKLSIMIEPNIKYQVKKYCHDDFIVLDKKSRRTAYPSQIYSDRVLILDTYNIYIFRYEDDEIEELMSLDDLTSIDDVNEVKNRIFQAL